MGFFERKVDDDDVALDFDARSGRRGELSFDFEPQASSAMALVSRVGEFEEIRFDFDSHGGRR